MSPGFIVMYSLRNSNGVSSIGDSHTIHVSLSNETDAKGVLLLGRHQTVLFCYVSNLFLRQVSNGKENLWYDNQTLIHTFVKEDPGTSQRK